jgi:hypothetical protein
VLPRAGKEQAKKLSNQLTVHHFRKSGTSHVARMITVSFCLSCKRGGQTRCRINNPACRGESGQTMPLTNWKLSSRYSLYVCTVRSGNTVMSVQVSSACKLEKRSNVSSNKVKHACREQRLLRHVHQHQDMLQQQLLTGAYVLRSLRLSRSNWNSAGRQVNNGTLRQHDFGAGHQVSDTATNLAFVGLPGAVFSELRISMPASSSPTSSVSGVASGTSATSLFSVMARTEGRERESRAVLSA